VSNILLIGSTGQLGWELQKALPLIGRVIALDRSEMDLADPDAIQRAIRTANPDVIVNAAGYTAVDKAESERDLAMHVNAIAPGIMAETAKKLDALLVHYSTVFVFDGNKTTPYMETDPPRPLNIYGESKLLGERAIIECDGRHIILRATWTYSDRRTNFPLTILRLARQHRELRIVNDQTGAPTSARAYAQATAQLLRRTTRAGDHSGIYHLSASGQVTRFEWALRILEFARARSGDNHWATLLAVTTADYPQAAKRPLYTIMDASKAERVFGVRMAPWDEDFRSFLVGLSPQLYTRPALSSN
jgi:dTDP-4-dehydrorhamnose reductase